MPFKWKAEKTTRPKTRKPFQRHTTSAPTENGKQWRATCFYSALFSLLFFSTWKSDEERISHFINWFAASSNNSLLWCFLVVGIFFTFQFLFFHLSFFLHSLCPCIQWTFVFWFGVLPQSKIETKQNKKNQESRERERKIRWNFNDNGNPLSIAH